MAQSRGIDVKLSADTSLVFSALLLDSSNAKLATGTTAVRLFHLVTTDGTLVGYDFADNTFKAGAATTPTSAGTHRTVDNATYSTGDWTYRLATLTGFVVGDQYIVEFTNTGATPASQQRLFQYGGAGMEDLGGKVLGGGSGTITAVGAWAAGDAGATLATVAAILSGDCTAYETTATGLRLADILVALKAVTFGKMVLASASSLSYYNGAGTTIIITIPNIASDYSARGVPT